MVCVAYAGHASSFVNYPNYHGYGDGDYDDHVSCEFFKQQYYNDLMMALHSTATQTKYETKKSHTQIRFSICLLLWLHFSSLISIQSITNMAMV